MSKYGIGRHGAHAFIEAAMRADGLLDEGDLDGQRVWMAVRAALRELQR